MEFEQDKNVMQVLDAHNHASKSYVFDPTTFREPEAITLPDMEISTATENATYV